jgi:hypothetical protein
MPISIDKPGYYGLPAVKHSHYRWTVGSSLFFAGLGGASQLMTTLLDFAGDGAKAPLVRAGRYTALAASIAAPTLYIKDLGTPSRWFNMMRVIRPTSVMSIGSWSLAVLGAWNGLVAGGQALRDVGYHRAGDAVARISSVPASAFGSVVTVYMGPELEETSTPLWTASSPLLPVLFAASNVCNALSVFELAAWAAGSPSSLVRRIGLLSSVGTVGEISVLRGIEKNWTNSGGLPGSRRDLLYRTGAIAFGKIASLAFRGLALSYPNRLSNLLPAASIGTLVMGFFLPIVLLFAGNRSADRPEDYFAVTRPPGKVLPGMSDRPSPPGRMARPARRRIVWRIEVGAMAAAAAGVVAASFIGGRSRGKEGRE